MAIGTSNRLVWPEEPSPLARLRDELERAGKHLVDLTDLNPTRVGIGYPDAEIRAIVAEAAGSLYEPEPFGSLSGREAVSEDFARRGIRVDPRDVCLTASTSESLALLFKLLADVGTSVLVPRPGYPLLEHLAPLDGLSVESYSVRNEVWNFESFSERIRAVLVTSPHMPFGNMPSAQSLAGLFAFCSLRGCAPIMDEVFADYCDEGMGSLSEPGIPVFRLGGLSKAAGLPGFKAGWIGCEGIGDEMRARLELIADAYLSPNQIVMNALPGLLDIAPRIRGAIRERVRSNSEALDAMGLGGRLRSTGASWTAVIEIAGDDEEFSSKLLREGFWAHPGYFYDIEESCIVVSLLTPPASFLKGLEAIRSL